MDEALVPHARRLRIGRSNFRLLSDISSKESTLQLVYDVLRLSPFFKAFFVTADVPEIYMQEFWATATVHHHSIRFKMDNKKHIVNLCSDTSITPPTATASPSLNASAKGKHTAKASKAKSLSALSEGFLMYPLMSQRKNSPGILLMMKERMVMIRMKRMRVIMVKKETVMIMKVMMVKKVIMMMTIRKLKEMMTRMMKRKEDEWDDEEDDEEEGGDDEQASDKEEFIHPSLSTHAEEETRDEESFDPIPKTPKNSDNEGNGEENLGKNVGREEGHDEKEGKDELYRDVNINQGMENDEFLKTIDENMQKIIKEQVKEQVKTSYVVVADLSEMELKKILIEKMEGNKSIQRSNEQRNLYKALVEAYESDKIILDTYRDTVTLKRHRDDDADKDEEPSAGSDRGSKRCREGKEPESASAPGESYQERWQVNTRV
nr:hypothetical protein [Tanacetum cinerariifolium]